MSGFKRTFNDSNGWSISGSVLNAIYFKYHSKTKLLNTPNPYLDFLIDTSFQGVDMISVLLLDPNDNRIGHLICYLPIAKVKDYNVTIEGKKNYNWSRR